MTAIELMKDLIKEIERQHPSHALGLAAGAAGEFIEAKPRTRVALAAAALHMWTVRAVQGGFDEGDAIIIDKATLLYQQTRLEVLS